MPPWAAFAPRSSLLCRRRKGIDTLSSTLRTRSVAIYSPAKSLSPTIFTAPSEPLCNHSHKSPCRPILRYWSRLIPELGLRRALTNVHVSPTAINARPNVPRQNEALHNALSQLAGDAETYVNISRLQLALRGLVAQDPVTRVAILGLNGQRKAARVARLLLADPLGGVEAWEKQLDGVGDGKAILLRFGDENDVHPPSPLYTVLSVPSRVLQKDNLEILISSLNTDVSSSAAPSTESSKDSVLVPKIQAHSASGHAVPFPVHKTLLVGEGVEDAVTFGRFTHDLGPLHTSDADLRDLVKLVIDFRSTTYSTSTAPDTNKDEEQHWACVVKVDTAEGALKSFRDSIQNSLVYERGWFASGMPALSTWLASGLHTSSASASTAVIKPTLRSLIASILSDVEASILASEALEKQKLASRPRHAQVSVELLQGLEIWAEEAHEELRDSLDEAFTSKNWHKIKWWKLMWRVDDISMILGEILERRWLVRAEKEGVYLAGRMRQAGFSEVLPPVPFSESKTADEISTATKASVSTNPAETSQLGLSTDIKQPIPWPSLISSTRASLLTTTIPPLQSLAQSLLMQSLSTTLLSSSISVLLWLSFPLSVVEAGSIGALGLVWSARRMARLWDEARQRWNLCVREEGRGVLRDAEAHVRAVLQSSQHTERVDAAEAREAARASIRAAREALAKT